MGDWVDAEQRIERAQQLCESKRWEEALEQLDCALQINPHNGLWWGSRAFLLDQLNRHDEAIEAYEAALEFASQDRDLLTALGVDYAKIGQMLQAIETFEKLEKLYPDYEPAFCHRLMIYAELGEHELAEEMFYSAQQIDESCPHCFWHLGDSLWARGEIQRAIYCWQRVLEIDPGYTNARQRIAEAHRRSGSYETAREYYLAEYREDPRRVDLLLDLADMFLHNGQLHEAVEKCRQSIELDPQHVRAFVLLGDAYNRAGEERQALPAYQIAARLDESRPGVHQKLGSVMMKLGRFEEAKQDFDLELELQPDDRAALMRAGNCALELAKPDIARKYFERLIEVDDCLPGAYHNLAVCHFLRNDYEEGIRQCQLALQLKGDYPLARHKLVLANMHLGRWAQAKRLLDGCLSLDPENPTWQRLRRRWRYRRMFAWARRLADSVKKLALQAKNC